MRQDGARRINRFAEAMTLFAVACAGLFPLLHLGRPWFFYWLLPYPNTMGLWPQFRSPLVWDVFAVSDLRTVSLLFWYIGLDADLATLRDRRASPYHADSSTACWRWAGAARRGIGSTMRRAYLLLAGLATPLVVSRAQHRGVDFAVGIVPGWHSTIFPPYFVAGAHLLRLCDGADAGDPAAQFFKLEDFITMRIWRTWPRSCWRPVDSSPTAM